MWVGGGDPNILTNIAVVQCGLELDPNILTNISVVQCGLEVGTLIYLQILQ